MLARLSLWLEATEKLNIEPSEIDILSIGTGRGKHIIKSNWMPKHFFYWLIPKPRLFDIILDSQSQITEQYLLFIKRLFKKKVDSFGYLRIQYDLGSDTIDLNSSEPRDIKRLVSIGSEVSKLRMSEIVEFLK